MAQAHLSGELRPWPPKGRLAAILRDAGFQVTATKFAIRLDDLSHFSFQDYGGYLAEPRLEAEAADAETLLKEATRVSEALAKAGIVHQFEIHQETGEMKHSLHLGGLPNAGA
jgi:hypothetical protein